MILYCTGRNCCALFFNWKGNVNVVPCKILGREAWGAAIVKEGKHGGGNCQGRKAWRGAIVKEGKFGGGQLSRNGNGVDSTQNSEFYLT